MFYMGLSCFIIHQHDLSQCTAYMAIQIVGRMTFSISGCLTLPHNLLVIRGGSCAGHKHGSMFATLQMMRGSQGDQTGLESVESTIFFFKDTIDLFWLEEKEHKKHSRGLAGKILALKLLWIQYRYYIYIYYIRYIILYYIFHDLIVTFQSFLLSK